MTKTMTGRALLAGILALFVATLILPAQAAARGKNEDSSPESRDLRHVLVDAAKSKDEKILAIRRIERPSAPTIRGLIAIYGELDGKDGMGAVCNELIHKVAEVTDPAVAKALREDLTGPDAPPRIRAALFTAAVTSQSDEETTAYVAELMEHGLATIRCLAVRETGARGNKAAFDNVLARLDDVSWRVQAAAIGAVGALVADEAQTSDHFKRGVAALLMLMRSANGRLIEDCAKALRQISGEDYGADADAWRVWFRKVSQDTSEEHPDRQTRTREPDPPYGIGSYSRQLVFVIDTSKSMEEPVDDAMRKDAERTITGRKSDEPSKRKGLDWSKIHNKLDLARAELIRAIEELSADTHFSIVAYNTDVWPWEQKLVEATPANKQRAIEFLEKITTGKLTNIYGALDYALGMAEAAFADRLEQDKGRKNDKDKGGKDKGGKGKGDKDSRRTTTGVRREKAVLDTIYFLTDGYATTGKYRGPDVGGRAATAEEAKDYEREMDAMLEEIRQRNELAGIKIHAIGIGHHDRLTLKKLAAQNGGTYVSLGYPSK